MKLNCKVGDLAIVVNGENAGRLVSVLRASQWGRMFWFVELVGSHGPMRDRFTGAERNAPTGNVHDSRLRPIRDQPGDDETLLWAGLPQDAGVPA